MRLKMSMYQAIIILLVVDIVILFVLKVLMHILKDDLTAEQLKAFNDVSLITILAVVLVLLYMFVFGKYIDF